MEYKFVELLSTAFVASDEDTVRQNISYRYRSVESIPSPNPNANPTPDPDPDPDPDQV